MVFFDVLASKLLPHRYLGEILQQDNAPSHKLAETQTWFFKNAVDILENWLPISPDLNIIEQLWSILKTSVVKRHPKNVDDLEKFVLEEFYAIPDFYVEKFFKSMKNRLNLRIINRGGFTRYWQCILFSILC